MVNELVAEAAELAARQAAWAAQAREVLLAVRLRYRWSQYILACKLGVSRESVANWESQRRPVPVAALTRLAQVLDAEDAARQARPHHTGATHGHPIDRAGAAGC